MSDPVAHVTVTRTNPADVAQRQIIVSIDGGPKKTLLFGDSTTFDVEPGAHKLRAHNTLVWKTINFEVATGQKVTFMVTNTASRWTFGFLAVLGAGPLYLKVERTDDA
jgi:hypothetical protein